jgi:hypothetical protein
MAEQPRDRRRNVRAQQQDVSTVNLRTGLRRRRGGVDDYLGWQTAPKIARAANYACTYDTEDFPDHPLYSGNPWLLPVVGGYYRLRDNFDRLLA